MSVNYTSYSPLMVGWSDDLNSIRDSEGRPVGQMVTPPADYWIKKARRREHGFLEFEGLVLLDQNNDAIVDFEGAPGTISGDAPPWHIEGLKRSLGMTFWE